MNKLTLIIFLCIGFYTINDQSINLKNGITFLKLNWYNSISTENIFKESYTEFSTTIGLDYFQKKYFYLSSNIGYLNIGGKGKTPIVNDIGNPIGDEIMAIKQH